MNGFTIYKEYIDLITLLPSKKDQSELLLEICNYMFFNKEPKLNETQTKIFNNLKRPLDKSKKRSSINFTNKLNEEQDEIEIEPKQNQNETKTKSKQNQNEIKKETHQDVTVNVNDNVNVFENKSVREETFTKIQNEFNSIGLSKVITLSQSRKDKLKSRINELGEDLIIEAIKKIPKSRFLMGNNDNGWKCTFDWLFENDKNILKIYEGNYDDEKNKNLKLIFDGTTKSSSKEKLEEFNKILEEFDNDE